MVALLPEQVDALQELARKGCQQGHYQQPTLLLKKAIESLDFGLKEHRLIAGRLRSDLAVLYHSQGKYAYALFTAQLSLAGLRNQTDLVSDFANASIAAGNAAWHRYGPEQSAQFTQIGLEAVLEQETPLHSHEITLRDNLGLALHSCGAADKAIKHYQVAHQLALSHLPDRVTGIKRRLSNAYQDIGHYALARSLLDEAAPDHSSELQDRIAWHNASALVQERIGDLRGALFEYEAAIKLLTKLGKAAENVAAVWSNAALLLLDLGDVARAKAFSQEMSRSLSCDAPMHSRLGLQRLLAALAKHDGALEDALEHWREADRILSADSGADPLRLASLRAQISNLLVDLDRVPEAIRLLQETLLVEDATLPEYKIELAIELARVFVERCQLVDAERLLRDSFASEMSRGNAQSEARLFTVLSDYSHKRKLDQSAIFYGKLAVEAVNRSAASFDRDNTYGRDYLAQRIEPHRKLIDRLVRDERIQEAIHIQRALKQEQIAEFARRDHAARTDQLRVPFTSNEEANFSAYKSLSLDLQANGDRAIDIRVLPDERRASAKHVELLRHQASELFDSFQRYAPSPAASSTNLINEVEDEGVPVLRFLGGSTGITVHFRWGESECSHAVGASVSELSGKVYQLRQDIELQTQVGPAARNLYELLFAPVEDHLTGVEGLDIVCDGPLRHLPYCCLHDGQRYLIEKLAISIRTAVSSRKRNKNSMRTWRSRGLSVSSALCGYPALPHTIDELRAIEDYASSCRLDLDEDFTKDALFDTFSDPPEHLHLATHFHFSPAAAHRSELLLGNGETVSLAELRMRAPNLSNLQLLVLSCCDSGSIDEGEFGPESMAALAHKAGAGDVVGSMWPISDAATSCLMRSFYKDLFSATDATVAECLRTAQLRLLRGDVDHTLGEADRGLGYIGRPQARWSHPYYWAGLAHYVSGY